MRKLPLLLAAAVAAALGTQITAYAAVFNGDANVHQIHQSGIMARFEYVDNTTAQTLKVDGTATGLVPGNRYFTLLYDNGSRPGGPVACEPSATDNISFLQMAVGFWTNHNDGTGEIHALKTGLSYVALDQVHTTSVRHVVGPPPAGFVLQACGEVHHSVAGP